MMKTKKSQSEIITTVLMVLVALAAIAGVAVFIIGQVRTGTNAAQNKAECSKITITIDSATAGSANKTIISRGNDDVQVASLKAYLDGTATTTLDIATVDVPGKLDKKTITDTDLALNAGKRLKLLPVLGNAYVCENGPETTIIA